MKRNRREEYRILVILLWLIRHAIVLALRVKNILEGPGKKMPIRPVFSQPDPFMTDGSGAAGAITSTGMPDRQIQFALKLEF